MVFPHCEREFYLQIKKWRIFYFNHPGTELLVIVHVFISFKFITPVQSSLKLFKKGVKGCLSSVTVYLPNPNNTRVPDSEPGNVPDDSKFPITWTLNSDEKELGV
jgi:hypothetical protein